MNGGGSWTNARISFCRRTFDVFFDMTDARDPPPRREGMAIGRLDLMVPLPLEK
jgi:hypothetical protein